ncbi:hypothetical protein GGTG_04090 [Gaeumannomyces tritici R3-111a-1]|uniref:polynucleotide adenylyltransferase n=1 Tax=Gaeumannomyces tritici (strain R3-111a-1) TaxID=644352 RepID=J3NS43_GAET3|nr:hypothetical protein GGTG_04090 [Gaeumannomyces tritici R3-111a-1]EJT78999.1 hypothetical protein GGTG_04090 [Gaeumannomyces tritici R3-111a-1]
MASVEPSAPEALQPISTSSHGTALCIIPPRDLWPSVDRLRALYDKAHKKWPPHLNLVYPFAKVESLERAADEIGAGLESWRRQTGDDSKPKIRLDSADVFPHRRDNTIFRCDSDEDRRRALQETRATVLAALGQTDSASHHRLHMTVAQSDDLGASAHKFLYEKVKLLPKMEWEVDTLHILVRERTTLENGASSSVMKAWGTVDLGTGAVSRFPTPQGFYEEDAPGATEEEEENDASVALGARLPPSPSFAYDEDARVWKRRSPRAAHAQRVVPRELRVSSYNVLAEFLHPPAQDRYPALVRNILSRQGSAEILVLQEVTDDFLVYLLQDESVRAAYPFVSHGPPCQDDLEPLPSFLNMVVLSSWPFEWEAVPFARRHKGAIVATFPGLARWEDGECLALAVAAVHLTHGLTDGAVAAKRGELQRVLAHLADTYEGHPWVLAGDFNMTTSAHTVSAALKKGDISSQTAAYLAGFDTMLDQAGLVDTWAASGGGAGSGGHDADEAGATFDPSLNKLAGQMVGNGLGNRPQRYDRILFRGEGMLDVAGFNMFGLVDEAAAAQTSDGAAERAVYGSDHWGIRCSLRLEAGMASGDATTSEISSLVVAVEPRKASGALEDVQLLRDSLSALGAFPTEDEAARRQEAFELLRDLILENPTGTEVTDGASAAARPRPPLVVTSVGSYGLGVWTPSSDIDVMCIGPYSSAVFMALAVQRIRKAGARGFKLVRRVRANTGTMLELEVQGVKMDLQYCAATSVAEGWPAVLDRPASDPVFSLPAQTLGKLKAARDLDYLRRSLPDLAKFRLAHRAVRTWARTRGIYSVRFGYLGGIQISVLLARVCKSLARDAGPGLSVADILVTFFHHYAAFDWQQNLAFDPFFHNKKLSYHRTFREPLAILGFFPPMLNTSHAATIPSVRAMAGEFRRAAALLASEDVTWDAFFRGGGPTTVPGPLSATLPSGAADFLASYKSFVKLELSYWGISLPRGAQFVGWFESRCPLILVDVSRRLPNVLARMWPERFVDAAAAAASAGDGQESDREYQGCYLVGLEHQQQQDSEGGTPSKEDQRAAGGTLQSLLQRFEELIRGDAKYYDSNCMWMSASVVRRDDLGGLAVDGREWGEFTAGDDEEDEEDEDEDTDRDGDDDSLEDDLAALSVSRKERKKKKGRKVRDAASSSASRPGGSGAKFRAAADVISRLRWDPSLDSSDYIVGYEDRFKGAMERSLDAWKSEQTDEEFIPQHRILYFKRRSDGVIVWERRTRKDELFGSG